MSKNEIEKRIRTLFYILFGIIFTFLFILTSSYLELNRRSNQNLKNQTLSFLIDGLQTRERFIYEDYHSHSFESISLRIKNFLEPKGISNYKLAILSGIQCEWGDLSLCESLDATKSPKIGSDIVVLERLDKVNLLIPIQGWRSNLKGRIALEIHSTDISPQQSIIDKLMFQILPFLCLGLISFIIYYYTEKSLIKPTIRRIIEGEKLQTQKDMVRQFAHDIRSPISVLEEIIECAPFRNDEANTLVVEALERIKGISNDLLSKEKRLNQSTNIKNLLEKLIQDKKREYKDRQLTISMNYDCPSDIFEINPNDLYRALSNLLNNSIEAVSHGPASVSINISQNSQGLSIQICDNGDGISEELLPLIDRGEYTSKENGHGLGIRGVKNWLSTLNGQFTMDSQVGFGTKVNLLIPS